MAEQGHKQVTGHAGAATARPPEPQGPFSRDFGVLVAMIVLFVGVLAGISTTQVSRAASTYNGGHGVRRSYKHDDDRGPWKVSCASTMVVITIMVVFMIIQSELW